MKNIKNALLIFIAMFVYLASCTKDPNGGIPGPRGPQGPPGTEVGPRGPAGPRGDNGGSVPDVFSSDWIPGKTSMITHDYGTGFVRMRLPIPELTKSILDSGIVIIYFKKKTLHVVHKLAYYTGTPGTGAGVNPQMSQLISVGFANIYTNIDVSTVDFRYIIIPGGKYIHVRRAKPWPEFNNYKAVCQYFGLKE